MIQQDWLMRQIDMLGRMLAKILFNKETAIYEFPEFEDTDAYSLHEHLKALIAAGKINEAENLLYDHIQDGTDLSLMEVALDFYLRLNELDNDRLEECGFSREESEEGLRDMSRIYGVNLNLG